MMMMMMIIKLWISMHIHKYFADSGEGRKTIHKDKTVPAY